jgi:hypothetical protein
MTLRLALLLALLLVSGISCQETHGPQKIDPGLADDAEGFPVEGPPVIVVTGRYLFPQVVSGITEPPLIIDLPSGKTVEFCWTVAGPRGGHEYRYGWDIIDLNDDLAWETDFMPFATDEACSTPRTFLFGVHTFHVEVVDDSGQSSRAGFTVRLVPGLTEGAIDIRPHVCPNPLPLSSRGMMHVALLGTPQVDVRAVIPESIRLGQVAPVQTQIRDIATPSLDGGECACADSTPDGLDDMILTFRLQDLGRQPQRPRGWRRGSRREVVLFLWGWTGEDPGFVASDCVVVPGPPRGHARPPGRDGGVMAE